MPVDLWTSPAFVEAAGSWVAAQAAAAGLTLTGEWEQPHARPWSSAIRFETDHGRLWFKVNGPGTAHEARLVSVLADVVPTLVPGVLAVEPERGWSLMRDAGPVLRTTAAPDELWDQWCHLLGEYAGAQVTLADLRSDLVATGVDVLSPDLMPSRLRELVDALRRTPVGSGGLTAEEADRLTELLPTYDSWCAELAASGIPASLNHDDLHSANVCVGPDGMRVIDWGDAVVSHPFGTMLATLNSVAWHAGTEADDPRVGRVRDAYLEPYAGWGTRADLLRWVDLARRTGCLTRALSYAKAFEGEALTAQSELDWPVRAWVLELLEG